MEKGSTQQAVPQILKREGLFYVRDIDGQEYPAKLSKAQDDKIFAEYNRINELTGEVVVQRLPLRKKKKEDHQAPDEPGPSSLENPSQSLLNSSRVHRYKSELLRHKSERENLKSERDLQTGREPHTGRGDNNPKSDRKQSRNRLSKHLSPQIIGETEIASQGTALEGNQDFAQDLEIDVDPDQKQEISFGEHEWSSAERLVIDFLPDKLEEMLFDENKDLVIVAHDDSKKKKVLESDLEDKAFRWKLIDAPDAFAPIIATDEFDGVEPREDGIEPSNFNVDMFHRKRRAAPFMNVVPDRFKQINLSKPIESLTPEEKVMSLLDLTRVQELSLVKYVQIDQPMKLNRQSEDRLYDSLNRLVNCEILILRNLGLRRIERLELRRLLAADLVNNNINDLRQVMRFCKNCPQVYQIDLRNNEIARRPIYPQLIAEVMSVQWYSGHVVTEQERQLAIAKFGTETMKRLYRAMKLWETALLMVPDVAEMTKWQPRKLQHLTLSNLGLERIFLGALAELETLDVSFNRLTTLEQAGLEKLDKLFALNISHNALSSELDLEVMQWVPALRVISLDANNFPATYRLKLLWTCRNLKGKNHWPGLIEIDSKKVTTAEVLQAHKIFGKWSNADLERFGWQLALIQYAGHYQLRLPGFTLRFANLSFPHKALQHADVNPFLNLEVLDLSRNDLVTVKGLNMLDRLRKLNLSANPRLDIDGTLTMLRATSSLWDASLAPTKIDADDLAGMFRFRIISGLFHHSKLRSVDGHVITVEERVAAFARMNPKLPLGEVETYTLNLKLTINATLPEDRDYSPPACAPGMQWQPVNVERLSDLRGLRLTNKARMDFAHFTNLRQLNLSNNLIRDVLPFRLDSLPRLGVLDLSFNKISNPLPVLAEHFDKFPELEVLCLRGNESIHSQKHRMELIGKMKTFRKMDCKLTVVDTAVTITERIKAWRDQGGSAELAEELKIKYQLQSRLPLELLAEEVRFINLNKADLVVCPSLTMYVNLQCLTLRHNNLTSIASAATLVSLKLLDVRQNKLTSIDECVRVINALPDLEVFAAMDNPFSGLKHANKYRSHIVARVPRLKEIENKFAFIDDHAITTEEIARHAFAKPHNDNERQELLHWQWATCVWREVSTLPDSSIIMQLNLSHSGLSVVGFSSSMFPQLKRLSLAGNRLTGPELANITQLSASLEELDITGNQILELDGVSSLVDELHLLRALWVENNPCFREDNPVTRHLLLGRLNQTRYLDAPLRVLNGFTIFVSERIHGLETARLPDFGFDKLAHFRTELALEAVRATPNFQKLYLNNFELTDLTPISLYTKVEFLDLSSNSLVTLVDQGLDKLSNLFWLDLRDNSFTTLLDHVIKPLSQCHNLRHLYLQRCTKTSETARVSDYIVNPVCHVLRGLESCDQNKNPLKLDENAELGAEYLFNKYQIPRNGLLEINLNGRDIPEEDFPQFCTALSYVCCSKLWCSENPWAKTLNYRFMLIHFGKTLVELDGQKVRMDERANAQRTVQQMKFDKKLYLLDRAYENTAIAATKLQTGMWADNLFLGGAIHQYAERVAVGTVLSKIEIVINFLQVYVMLFNLTIKWPNWWYNFNIRWIYLINIDLELAFLPYIATYQYVIKFVVLAMLPLAIVGLYQIDPREDKWLSYYVSQGQLSNRLHALELLLMGGLSVFVGFIVDVLVNYNEYNSWHRLADGKQPTELCKSVIAALVAVGATYWLFRWVVVLTYRRQHKSTTYWFSFIKIKKKIALFCLTVAYQPIARNALVNFASHVYTYSSSSNKWELGKQQFDFPVCMSHADMARSYANDDSYCCQRGIPDRSCLTSTDDLEWFHYISMIMCVVYIIGIPYFVFRQIQEGIREIDVNYNVPQKIVEQKALEADMKKSIAAASTRRERNKLKKDLKKSKKAFRALWYRYCREYSNAQNYLYFSYTRSKRYTKVVIMFEKLILLGVLLFFSTPTLIGFKMVAGIIVIGLYFVSVLLSQPFSDVFEDTMDSCCRFTNTFNAFVGLLAERISGNEATKSWLQSTALGTVNIVNISILLFILCLSPVRAWWVRRQAIKELEKKHKAEEEMKRQKANPTEGVAAATTSRAVQEGDTQLVAADYDGGLDQSQVEVEVGPRATEQSALYTTRGDRTTRTHTSYYYSKSRGNLRHQNSYGISHGHESLTKPMQHQPTNDLDMDKNQPCDDNDEHANDVVAPYDATRSVYDELKSMTHRQFSNPSKEPKNHDTHHHDTHHHDTHHHDTHHHDTHADDNHKPDEDFSVNHVELDPSNNTTLEQPTN